MTFKKLSIILLLLVCSGSALADTPASLVSAYAADAAKKTPGFTPSVQRGQAFFTKEWNVSKKMPNCTVCHSKNLRMEGKHVITNKRIAPFSPAVNPKRFTKAKKVEKWFSRNCTEVVGRECSSGEKADFIQYISQGDGL